jgi:hypothetical protein
MSIKKIKGEDKALIKAYVKWHVRKFGEMPSEFECSRLIENMYGDHRILVENYLSELSLATSTGEILR